MRHDFDSIELAAYIPLCSLLCLHFTVSIVHPFMTANAFLPLALLLG